MKCPSCDFDNPEGVKFCGQCGVPQAGRCPNCGSTNPPQFKFCGECGASLTVPPASPGTAQSRAQPKVWEAATGPTAPEAERRQLTVMFCDLVGSTALSAKLDPEALRTLLRVYQEACTGVVNRYGGYVARFMGDGMLAYFGYPRAHEDDAEHAIHAGLGIVESVRKLEGRAGVDEPLAVRIGIATGRVVVGDIVGEGAAQEAAVTGETPNLAARLQELAEANDIVISANTHKLLGDLFTFSDMEAHELKGFSDPVRAWRVVGEGRAEMRFEARSGELTPLVGRDEELDLLLRRWQRAKGGEGQVILVSGEPGIGKSRLVNTLRERVANEPHFRLRYQCSPVHTNSALYPVVARLERAAGFDRRDPPDVRLTKLKSLLAVSGTPTDETIALFAGLLSIPTSDRYPTLNLEPGQQKERTLRELVAQVAQLTELRPVLFVLEDAQWADPTSLEFFDLIVEMAPTARVAVIVTFRPEFNAPWAGQAHTTSVIVNRMSTRDSREFVDRLTTEAKLPEAVLNEIVVKTDGVPLFIEELTRTLLESGYGTSSFESDFTAASIPSTLQDSLMARLDGLETGKAVAQMGAVLGREFSRSLLSKISDLPIDQIDTGLARLEGTGLLHRRSAGVDAVYTFKHSLIRDTAYRSLLRERRHELHARAATVLESDYPDVVNTQPELLAHHHTEAGATEQALGYWQKAGHRAAERAAYREAAASFEQALVALRHLPETRESLQQGIDLRFDLRSSLQALGEHERVSEHLREAETLASALGDQDRLGWTSAYLSQYLWRSGDRRRAEELGQRALAIASELGDFGLQAVANFFLGQGYFNVGDYRRAIDHCRRNVEVLDGERAHERLGLTGLPSVLSRAWLAWSLAEQGEFPEAMVHAEEALSIAEAVDHPYSVAAACLGVGQVQLVRGALAEAIPVLERAAGLCKTWDLHVIVPMTAAVLGLAYALCGRVTEALPLLEEGDTQGPRVRIFDTSTATTALGTGYLLAGRMDEAGEIASRAAELAAERGFRGSQARSSYLLGEISARHDPPEAARAEDLYRRALGLADELGMRPLVADCHLGLGTLYRRTGERRQAQEHLSTAIEMYREMDIGFWLAQAEAELEMLG